MNDPIVDRTQITFKSGSMAEKFFKTKMLIIASCLMPEIENHLTFERSIKNEKKLFNPKERVCLDSVIGCTKAQIRQVKGIEVPSEVME